MAKPSALMLPMMVLLLSGCGVLATPPRDLASPGLPTSSTPSTSPLPAPDFGTLTSVSCEDSRPPYRRDFEYNRDWVARDAYVGVNTTDYVGGTANFEGADAEMVGTLIGSGFMDPWDRQNASPTMWAIFKFLCAHPGTLAEGYVVSPDRPDYRVTLETIYSETIDPKLRQDALGFCRDTPEKTLRGHLECFWD